jgi:uncharacterized protein (TIRG00374 family)
MRQTWVRWFVGVAISAGLLVWAFQAVNPAEVWQKLISADHRFLPGAVACTTLTSFLRGIRWKLCFERQDRVTFWQSNAAYSIGALSGQTVVPARLGDLVRVYVLGRVSSASTAKALGTLVIERLSDLFAVVMMLTLLLPLFSLPSWIKAMDGFAAASAVAALIIVDVIARRTETIVAPRWVTQRRLLQAVFGMLIRIMAGFSAVKDRRRALLIVLVSFALWITQTGTYAISFSAVHIPLEWKEGALTTGVLALTAIIPTGPGFAGSFELVTQQLLGLFNVDATQAVVYQEYTRAVNLIAGLIYAAVCVIGLKLAGELIRAGGEDGAPQTLP